MKVVMITIAALLALVTSTPARATFSILACGSDGCGAAVATNNLAVGATVIYAKAGVGAVASQFETNPSHGPRGLTLLEGGRDADAALREVLRTDDGFEGQDISYRQVGIVGTAGSGAAYTGKAAANSSWAGALTGSGYAIQGNGLAGSFVLDAMRERFLATRGTLANRLLAALEAGQAAGGQTTGRLSAALLVRTSGGGFQDVDLRVDAADRPIPELRRLLGMYEANAAMARAERAVRNGRMSLARANLADAIRLGAGWDRIWRRAARLEISMGDKNAALQALAALASINAVWARSETEDPLYAHLWEDADVAKWRQDLPGARSTAADATR